MDSSEQIGNLNSNMEAVALNDNAAVPDDSSRQRNTSPADILRIKQQMSNQCFEMAVQLQTGTSKGPFSPSDSERDLPDYVSELERVKMEYFNSTLALHRMQMWHAIAEKLKQNDSEAHALKAVSDRCMALCSQIKELQKESRELQGEITDLQKNRLELKRLTREKMKELEEVMSKNHPDEQKYKAVLEKGQANMEKYKKLTIMTQNVLRGIILACKINWLDDPDLRDIAMTLEEFPISD
ncbi:centromere protein H [Betta splendens]|uniref:Centromere protein H n=1 Tax=Betta splendens TaxID=158456 RepID=A0A6P7NIY4_BETSP|nr:centromere protein H [Betta splendens]XP_029019827.1 centromere protein H [Betta splendens]